MIAIYEGECNAKRHFVRVRIGQREAVRLGLTACATCRLCAQEDSTVPGHPYALVTRTGWAHG